jgi:hypothetical protein
VALKIEKMIDSIDFTTGLSYTLVAALIIGVVNLISTKIYNFYTGSKFNFLWKDKLKSFNKSARKLSFEELKRRLKIVIIDDEDIFPITLFKDNGYTVDKWDTVEDYSKLESGFYDIIVLDILGVAGHISANDGFGVLESLKNYNPSQIIIAYSAHSYDLTKKKFWEMADETIPKPSQFLKMKEVIDNVITTKFNPNRYLKILDKTLEKYNIRDKEKKLFQNEYLNAIEKKQNPDWEKILDFTNDEQLKRKIKTISRTIVKNFTHYGS